MAASPAQDQVSLKLLVNEEKSKVYFAEAGKDFVDVLFSFLTFPLGTVARLVSNESNMPPVSVACLTSLYNSVAKLGQQRLISATCEEMLLWPKNSSEDYCRSLKLNIDDTEQTKFFLCEDMDSCSKNLLSNFRTKCDCGRFLEREVPFKNDSVFKGFVKDGATFIITDDLTIMPNSMDTRLTGLGLLQNWRGDARSMQLVTVNVTHKKVLDLLKCSVLSKSALTDFFLEKEPLLVSPVFCPFDVAAQSSIKINVKLMMRKSDGKILYAQGEEDFANFLLSFLSLPLGAVVRLLEGHSSVGCIDGLYNSIVDLNETKYFIHGEAKTSLVDPRVAPPFKFIKQSLPISEPCSFASHYNCLYNKTLGLRGSLLGHNKCYVTSPYRSVGAEERYKYLVFRNLYSGVEGFVKGPTMYMATDSLFIASISPIREVSLLSRIEVPVDDLMEKAITIGIKEGVSIVKASLTSKSALTNGLRHLITQVNEEITPKMQ